MLFLFSSETFFQFLLILTTIYEWRIDYIFECFSDHFCSGVKRCLLTLRYDCLPL